MVPWDYWTTALHRLTPRLAPTSPISLNTRRKGKISHLESATVDNSALAAYIKDIEVRGVHTLAVQCSGRRKRVSGTFRVMSGAVVALLTA
jgi:hypothetical protein